MDDLIISQPMTFTVDVRNGLVERPQRESLMRGDKMANRIIAELMYGSEPFDITGVTVKGKFCRPPSGDEIDLAGEAKGNVAEVQLTDQCYTSGGHYEARVILVLGGVERTVLFISGDVLKSGSGNAASDEETGGSGGSTGSGLPAGGTAGQVLVKVSSAQGDAIWKKLTAADVGARPDNWMPTAADVGALGKNETAVNANALNGKDAKYYIQPRNLLDNSDFTNPVNQRGASGTVSTAGYFIDRWKLVSGSVTISDAGLTLNGVIAQIVENVKDVEMTAAASAGTAAFDAATNTFTLTGSGVMVTWTTLYEGEYTAETLPPYVPKGYAVELAECKRRYQMLSNQTWSVVSFGVMETETLAQIMLPLSMPFDGNPSIDISGVEDLRIKVGSSVYEVESVAYQNKTNAYTTVSVTLKTAATAQEMCILITTGTRADGSKPYIALSKDL